MTFSAHIFYTGIVSLFEQANKGIHILAPQAVDRSPHSHFTWLKCDPQQVVGKPSLTLIPLTGKSQYAFFVGGNMTIGEINEKNLRKWERSTDTKGVKYGEHNLVPLVDLKHTTSMPGKSYLNAAYLGDDPNHRIGLRSLVAKGYFDIARLDHACEWAFAGKPNNWRRLAQVVCHGFTVKTQTLKLTFENAEFENSIQLSPRSTNSPVLVEIGNTPIKDIFPPKKAPKAKCKDDHHVKIFEKIDWGGDGRPAQHLIGRPCTTDEVTIAEHMHQWPSSPGAAPQGANCPPGWWDDKKE